VLLQAPLYLRTSRRYRNVLLLLLLFTVDHQVQHTGFQFVLLASISTVIVLIVHNLFLAFDVISLSFSYRWAHL